jgi:hypothetical protein
VPRKFFNLRFDRQTSQDSVGGTYLAPEGQGLPCCTQCDRQMIPFLQFTLPAAAGLPFVEGSRLSVLMCPEHNEIPSFESFNALPPAYWEQGEGHWYASLEKPRAMHRVTGTPILQPAELVLADAPADENYRIAVGGAPDWLQASNSPSYPAHRSSRTVPRQGATCSFWAMRSMYLRARSNAIPGLCGSRFRTRQG